MSDRKINLLQTVVKNIYTFSNPINATRVEALNFCRLVLSPAENVTLVSMPLHHFRDGCWQIALFPTFYLICNNTNNYSIDCICNNLILLLFFYQISYVLYVLRTKTGKAVILRNQMVEATFSQQSLTINYLK